MTACKRPAYGQTLAWQAKVAPQSNRTRLT